MIPLFTHNLYPSTYSIALGFYPSSHFHLHLSIGFHDALYIGGDKCCYNIKVDEWNQKKEIDKNIFMQKK
jgi:hypothetical protein